MFVRTVAVAVAVSAGVRYRQGMKAMILAAGLGTRLRPLTLELPKPLVWVGDRPAIAHVAERLVAAGIEDIVINTFHRAEAFSAGMLARVPGRLSIVTEAEILGTGGGLANAKGLLGDGDVVVWNGDILAALDVAALVGAHRGGATLAVAPRARGEGTVGLGAPIPYSASERGDQGAPARPMGARVVRLRGEVFGEEVAGGDFLGIYVVGEEIRRRLPIPGCLVGDGLLPWLRSGGEVRAVTVDVTWDDIGSVEAYLRANTRWLAATGREAYFGEGAVIDSGVQVIGSVIGAGAVVRGEGAIEGCVVWPGATATAPLARTVVTTEGRTAR